MTDQTTPAAELTATLVIGRSYSRCGHCEENTLPQDTHHVDICGWTPEPGAGCGARFVAMRSDYNGTGEELRAIRPDLPIEDELTDQPAPSDAELIEHAREVGMVEPEKAPAYVAAYRAHVERQAAAEPTHEGPDPSHGGLTTHRGPREDCTGPDCGPDEEQPAPAAPGDLFTEAAIYASALNAGITAIQAKAGRDPWATIGDAVEVLRSLARHHTTAEQPTGITWEARAEHAVRLYATTAIELEDARRDVTKLRAERNEAVATVARLEQKRVELEKIANAERARFAAVERLCSGRPGYHTITVKALLTAMSDADGGPAPVSDEALTSRLETVLDEYRDEAGDLDDHADIADNLIVVIKQAGR